MNGSDQHEEAVFEAAPKLHGAARAAYLEEACANDLALRDRVEGLAAGKPAEAEPLARECLAMREAIIPDDWRTFNARSVLGGCLLGQKKFTEAEPLLISGYEGMKRREDKIPPAGKVRPQQALQRLVQLYEETNRPDQAARWKQKLTEAEKAL